MNRPSRNPAHTDAKPSGIISVKCQLCYVYSPRGSTLVRAGFYREAFDHFKDAMHFVARYFRDGRDLAPSIYTGFTEVGQACLKQGLHHELVAMYDKVLKGEDGQLLAQDDARVLQMRRLYAIAYLDGQEYDKAIDVLKGLVETLVCKPQPSNIE